MATHEAGIVDQMQRRVIELSAGDIVRDERSAGYGATLGDVDEVFTAVPRSTPTAEPTAGSAAEPRSHRVTPPPTRQPVPTATAAAAAAAAARRRRVQGDSRARTKPAKTPGAAPKVGKKVMDEKQPLYVEPEERDEVTDAAAAITAAATGAFRAVPAERRRASRPRTTADDGSRCAKAGAGASDHLTLAERLGLRAPGGPREGDDEQEVGPTQ